MDRGCNASNVREALGEKMRGKTVGEIAYKAAEGDPDAERAINILKQVRKGRNISHENQSRNIIRIS